MLRWTSDNIAILLPDYLGYPFLRVGYILIGSVVVNMRLIHIPVLLLNFAFVRVLVAPCMLQGRAVHLRMMVHESATWHGLHLLLVCITDAANLHAGRPDVPLHLLGLQILAMIIVGTRESRWIVTGACAASTTTIL